MRDWPGSLCSRGFFAGPAAPQALKASADDRGTTRLIVVTYAVAVDLPLVARWLPMRPLPPPAAPAGLLTQATGLIVRAWSMRVLGQSYSRTLRAEGNEQPVINTGPYRLVRHPGYLGSLLTWTGFALTSRSAPVVALITGLLGAAYRRRITAEEELLRRDLPGYTSYGEQTKKKLIPFVW